MKHTNINRLFAMILVMGCMAPHSIAQQIGQIGLQANSGHWVVAEGGGGQQLKADRTSFGDWEKLLLTDFNGVGLFSGDEIALQAFNGQFIAAENGGGQEVIANRLSPGPWEWFKIYRTNGYGVIKTGDSVYLEAYNGQYWTAEYGGGDVVNADRSSVGPWETFTITKDYSGPDTGAVYLDISGDGFEDIIYKAGSFRNNINMDNWTTYCYDYWYYPVELYFSFWDRTWGSLWPSTPDFSWIWIPDPFWSSLSSYAVCDTFVEPMLEFYTEEGFEYRIYKDDTGGSSFDINNWDLVLSSDNFGTGLQTLYLGTLGADDLYLSQYFIVKITSSFDVRRNVFNISPESYVRPFTSSNPVSSFYSQYSLTYNESETIHYPNDPEATANAIFTKLETMSGRSIEIEERQRILTNGCVDIARILMKQDIVKIGNELVTRYPERGHPIYEPGWDVRAYATLADAEYVATPTGFRKLYILVQSNKWKEDTPPNPDYITGEIPVNSLYLPTVHDEDDYANYLVRMSGEYHDKWFNITHGLDDKNSNEEIKGKIYDNPPPENFSTIKQIFVVVFAREIE